MQIIAASFLSFLSWSEGPHFFCFFLPHWLVLLRLSCWFLTIFLNCKYCSPGLSPFTNLCVLLGDLRQCHGLKCHLFHLYLQLQPLTPNADCASSCLTTFPLECIAEISKQNSWFPLKENPVCPACVCLQLSYMRTTFS